MTGSKKTESIAPDDSASNERRRPVPPEQLALREVISSQVSYSGPLPPPDLLADYERVMPGVGQTIIQSFVAEGEHRREGERRQWELVEHIERERITTARLNPKYAFGLVVLFTMAATTAIVLGYPWPATVILGSDLVSLVAAFIYSRRARVKEVELQGKQASKSQDSVPASGAPPA